MLGARLYPSSDELSIRRAYFYHSIDADEGAKTIVNRECQSVNLRNILLFKLEKFHDGDYILKSKIIEEMLNNIVDTATEFDDESIIQLVAAANSVSAYDWLKENREKIQKRCIFQETLLSELINLANYREDYEYGVSLAEELTMIDPFCSSYWELLTHEYICNHNKEKASNALEYALAIDPYSVRGLTLKAQIIQNNESDNNIDECYEILRKIIANNPDDLNAINILSRALTSHGHRDEALELFVNYHNRHLDDRNIVDQLLLMGYPNVEEIIEDFYNSTTEHSSKYWIEWAQDYAYRQTRHIAVAILKVFLGKNTWLENIQKIYIEQLYFLKDYDKVIEYYDKFFFKRNGCIAITYDVDYMVILSCLRIGDKTLAHEHVCKILSNFEWDEKKSMTSIERLARNELKNFSQKIKTYIENGEEFFVEDLDPFIDRGYW